jgi:hypothetical protein
MHRFAQAPTRSVRPSRMRSRSTTRGRHLTKSTPTPPRRCHPATRTSTRFRLTLSPVPTPPDGRGDRLYLTPRGEDQRDAGIGSCGRQT